MVFCTFFITKMMRMSGRMQPMVMTERDGRKSLGISHGARKSQTEGIERLPTAANVST